jgi:membrane-bound metal-dependent hydrolase YbcI (DUF457 family)
MFAGHLAVALGAKRAAPRVPLAVLVAAAFWLDLVWPVLLLAGVEHVTIDPGNTAFTPLDFDHYPWSHSLLMSVVWGAVVWLIAAPWLRGRAAGALVAATVVSHWVLDFVTHRPDLPLWPGGPLAGLGLWNSLPGTYIVEGLLIAGAVELYRRSFPARDAVGRWSLAGLVAVVGLIWIGGPFGPPPPSATAIATVGLAMWLFPLWAIWIERHRG